MRNDPVNRTRNKGAQEMRDGHVGYRSLLVVVIALVLSGCATGPSTFDRAYEQALRFGNEPRRGIMLFLHGCDGLGGPSLPGWEAAWVRHLTDRGFLVVALDSFADPRPGQSCQLPYLNKEEIYLIRAKQVALAIERIRSTYPTSRLLVWGHSEGGGVANLVTATVDGIITTGYQCGYRVTARTAIRPEVPLLAIMGAADPFVSEVLRFAPESSADALCRKVLSSEKWRAVIVPNMPHAASLEWAPVRDALDRFLDDTAP
jgi:alpha-beta hydrolase superfamily lysophospholipase